MRIGTFSFSWPREVSLTSGIWGAKVGVLELWKALLRFSEVEIDLFVHPCELGVWRKIGFLIHTVWFCEEENNLLAPLSSWEPIQFLFAQGMSWDWEEMLEALETLAREEELRKQMGLEARRRAVERFSWEVIVPEYEELWMNLKEKAAKYTPSSSHPPCFVDYREIFQPYPSYTLLNSMIVSLTNLGLDLKEGDLELFIYDELENLINRETLEILLDSIDGEKTVGQLSSLTDEAQRHLLWLAKQGVIQLRKEEG